jgi:hypothetical protein
MSSDLPQPDQPEPPDPAEPELVEPRQASDHPEDRIGAFAPFILATDALELREICAGFFERVKDEAWGRRTELRAAAWTMREALAHLDAVSLAYGRAVADAVAGRPIDIPGLPARTELKAWNRAEIAARAQTPVAELVASLLDSLGELSRVAGQLEPETLSRTVAAPMFSAPPTIGELLGGALSHLGIVHGAQITVATRGGPLWNWYRPGMMRRQLTRFFHTMGLAYRPDRGGSLHATIAFTAIGQGGGSWYVRASPQGGSGHLGVVRTSDVHLTFASPDLLCRVMTVQTSPWRHLLLREIKVRGRLRLARDFPRLFTPT